MTPEQIAADRAVCDAATAGEWVVHNGGSIFSTCDDGKICGCDYCHARDKFQHRKDAAFIAAARTRWPAALDEIERLQGEGIWFADPPLSSLEKEIERLRDAIRRHRDERGDDRCWMDDERLYAELPEGYTPPARDTTIELDNCRRFIVGRRNPATEYVSPQREIERLRAAFQYLADESDIDGTRAFADDVLKGKWRT